jgi:hypothetical protein
MGKLRGKHAEEVVVEGAVLEGELAKAVVFAEEHNL